jgi:hypothetical protein
MANVDGMCITSLPYEPPVVNSPSLILPSIKRAPIRYIHINRWAFCKRGSLRTSINRGYSNNDGVRNCKFGLSWRRLGLNGAAVAQRLPNTTTYLPRSIPCPVVVLMAQ